MEGSGLSLFAMSQTRTKQDYTMKTLKFSTEQQALLRELLATNCRIANEADNEDRARCLLEDAETTKIHNPKSFLQKNNLRQLQVDRRSFVTMSADCFSERAAQAAFYSLGPRKLTAVRARVTCKTT